MTLERTRVIIADDESLVRTDLREALTELGYLVVGDVGDGHALLEFRQEYTGQSESCSSAQQQ